MESQIHEKVKSFIKYHKLIQAGDELILGVSGGADSMMMLHYFYIHQKEYGITLKTAHIHHGLRRDADLDAELVEDVCGNLGVPFYRHDCDIRRIAKEKKLSEEEAGRLERYDFFISLLKENSKIVTAHNMNDQAETMLMRFIRGTDIKGLSGIRPMRERIIRPLLCLSREEIEAYCKEQQIPFRHDETNFKPIYTRNKMRLECVPYIKEAFNPNIISTLGSHSEVYREEEDFLCSYTHQCFNECMIQDGGQIILKTDKLAAYHPYIQKRIFMMSIEKMIGCKDITLKHLRSCMQLIGLQSGKQIHLPAGLIARKDYKGIIFSFEEDKQGYCFGLTEGRTWIPEINGSVELTRLTYQQWQEKQRINQKNENNYTKYIDYGKIKIELQIRTRRPADYIQLGKGTKKLKKLFIDDKISKTLRDTMPLIADGDEIVWVIGNRLNTKYYVTDCTKEILEVKILKGHE